MNVNLTCQSTARQSAQTLAQCLRQRETDRVVFAESCTCGLVAALMGEIPGISNWLCGSAVTYRESVKQRWLDVAADTLASHSAESIETTCEMAIGVLEKTSEANLSAAITGHLGPDAPLELDGKIFVAIAARKSEQSEIIVAESCQLESSMRVDRQFEATGRVLELLSIQLRKSAQME